jgi:hypothetical protein
VVPTRGKGNLSRAIAGGTKSLHKTTSDVWRFYRY